MVPLGKIFGRAWKYSLNWRRVAPFFILLVPFVVLFTAFVDSAAGFFSRYGMLSTTGTLPLDFAFALVPFFILLIFVGVVVFLADLYVRGVLIENARQWYLGKRLSLRKTRPLVRGRFISLLGSIIVVKIVSAGLGAIPLVGFIFAIVLTWLFLVVLQSVIVSKRGALDAIRDSFDLFMSRKLDTVVFWLIVSVISIALFIVALVPLLIAAWPVVTAFISSTLSGGPISAVLAAIKSNLPQIFVGGLISAFILGFMQVFKESATTFFYMEAKKKKR